VTPEQELLQRIRRALAEADVDADALVADAYEQARDDVAATLRRLISQDLLARALESLGGSAPPRGVGPAPAGESVADEPPVAPSPAASAPEAPREPGERAAPASPPAGAPRERAAPGSPPAEEPAAPRAGATGTATYVFGLVAADADVELATLTPFPEAGDARLLEDAGVQAVVCDVDPTAFDVLRSPGPEGLDVLAAVAHAHDATLAALAAQTTVLPLPLGTIVPRDEDLRALLVAHGGRLRRELARFAGRSEWAVTVRDFDDPADHDGESEAREAASGRDYLQRRGDALERRATRWSRREALATGIHEQLAAHAVSSDVVTSRPVEDVAPPLLHGVYLLDTDAVGDFEAAVASLRREHDGAVIEMTGPWPPYHFSAVDLSASPGPTP
jgi:hypothetical protein